jgi:hypothetical protein
MGKKKTGTAATPATPKPHRSYKLRTLAQFDKFAEFLVKTRPVAMGVLPLVGSDFENLKAAVSTLSSKLVLLPDDMPASRGRAMSPGDVIVFREKCKDLPKGLLDLTGKLTIASIPNAAMVVIKDEKGASASFSSKTIQRVKP